MPLGCSHPKALIRRALLLGELVGVIVSCRIDPYTDAAVCSAVVVADA